MKVNYLIACDGVLRTHGKLNVLGIFTVITVQRVPCLHPYMALVAELNAEPGEHEFLFRFRGTGDEDLTPQTPLGKFRVDDVGSGEVVAELRNFPIVKTGFLAIQLVIDGKLAGQRDLIVRSMPSNP